MIILLLLSYYIFVNIKYLLYKFGCFKIFDLSQTYSICVGNLDFGGTGKTPCVEFLIDLLKDDYHINVISAGYKRKTNSYACILADESKTVYDIGDEPKMLFDKYKHVDIAVCKDRIKAYQTLCDQYTTLNNEVFIFDDALQYKKIKCRTNIVLTRYDLPFFKDRLFPYGLLRDTHKILKSADVIIVTKCPDKYEKDKYIEKIRPYVNSNTRVLFSKLIYDTSQINTTNNKINDKQINVILVTGIAYSYYCKKFIEEKYTLLEHIKYGDHYDYNEYDIKYIVNKYHSIDIENKVLVTTEKDYVKLNQTNFKKYFDNLSIKVLPIYMNILDNKLSTTELKDLFIKSK